jgi:hypothetical protein
MYALYFEGRSGERCMIQKVLQQWLQVIEEASKKADTHTANPHRTRADEPVRVHCVEPKSKRLLNSGFHPFPAGQFKLSFTPKSALLRLSLLAPSVSICMTICILSRLPQPKSSPSSFLPTTAPSNQPNIPFFSPPFLPHGAYTSSTTQLRLYSVV